MLAVFYRRQTTTLMCLPVATRLRHPGCIYTPPVSRRDQESLLIVFVVGNDGVKTETENVLM
jgi:hypothetical protein